MASGSSTGKSSSDSKKNSSDKNHSSDRSSDLSSGNGKTLQPEGPLAESPAKGLFLGEVPRAFVFPYPKVAAPDRDTLALVLDSIDKFMAGKDKECAEYDKKGAQPPQYIDELKELGLFGLIIPEEYGGLGLSNGGYSRVLQQLTRYDGSTSLTVGAHSSIGMKGLLLFGNDEQKARYLPKLATGEMVAAFCLTEPGSGSDAASIKTNAVRNGDGSYTLNGEKIWITNGPIAEFFTVFARTDGEAGKLSAFIVERSFPGLTTGPKEDKMGIRASATSTVSFSNVRVPPENLLGEAGKGFKIAMAILNNGRTGLGGGCVGAMKRVIQLSIKQSKERKQFGKSISEFGLMREKIAMMSMLCFAAESTVGVVSHMVDSGHEDFSTEAAISKILATEALWFVGNEGLQIAGGNGFMKEFPYELIVRDSRINMIFEGTNEILRLYVALSGLKDAGDYLKGIGKSLGNIFNDPIKGFGILAQYATKKISQRTAIGREDFDFLPKEYQDLGVTLGAYTLALAESSETLLRKYGKSIIDEQLQMKRAAEVAIDLFSGYCVVSRASKLGKTALPLTKLYVNYIKRRMNQNLRRVERNEDAELNSLASYMLEEERYPWDLLSE